MNTQEEVPVAFISYSHDSHAHKRWVGMLASRLVDNGVDVILDQWSISPGADLARFMEDSVRRADRVLVVCTEEYVHKANGRAGGVGYEAMMVTGELIRDLGSTRFIPLVRQERSPIELPAALTTRLYIDFSDAAAYEARFEELLRELHGAPAIRKPTLGQNPFAAARTPRVARPTTALTSPTPRATRPARVRIPREHTDADRDSFLEDAFELMARHFEAWLTELEAANSHIKTRLKRIDARQLSAVVYRHGDAVSRCRIRLNLGGRGLGSGITYSNDDSDFGGNSFNESLSAESNGVSLFLRPLGLAHQALGNSRSELAPEEAAELYWSIMIAPLQR